MGPKKKKADDNPHASLSGAAAKANLERVEQAVVSNPAARHFLLGKGTATTSVSGRSAAAEAFRIRLQQADDSGSEYELGSDDESEDDFEDDRSTPVKRTGRAKEANKEVIASGVGLKIQASKQHGAELAEDDSEDDHTTRVQRIDRVKEVKKKANDPEVELETQPSKQHIADLVEIDDSDDVAAELRNTTSAKRIYTDQNLSIVQRLETLFNASNNLKTLPPIHGLYAQTLASVSAQNKKAKQYVVQKRKRKTSKLRHVHNAGDPYLEWRNRARTQNQDPYTLSMLNIDDDEIAITFNIALNSVGTIDLELPATLRRFAAALETIVNAWPYALPGLNDRHVKQVMVQAALVACGGGQTTINAPHALDHHGMEVNISFINEVTGEYEVVHERSKQGFVAGRPFQIPAHVDFINQSAFGSASSVMKTINNGVATWATSLPNDILSFEAFASLPVKPTIAALRNREHFYRYVAYRLTDLVSTKEKMRRMIAHMEVMYGTGFTTRQTKRLPAIPGFAYFIGDQTPGYMVIRVIASVCLSMGLKTAAQGLHFYVRTTDGRRLARIMEVTKHTLAQAFDFHRAVRVLALEIDKTHAAIEAGLPPPPACNCPADMRMELMHTCTVCCKEFPCAELFIGQSGTRRCLQCDPEAHVPFKEDVLERSLAAGVQRAMQREYKKVNEPVDTPYFKTACEEVLAAVLARQQPIVPGSYRDEYLQQTVNYTPGHNPFLPSIEAVLPFGRREADGRILRHTVDNTIVAGLGLNLWHKGHHIGNVQEALNFARSTRSLKDVANLVSRVEDMMAVPRPSSNKNLKEFPNLTKEEYELQRHEFVTGRPLQPVSETDKKIKYRLMLNSQARGGRLGPCQWSTTQMSVVKKVCLQIQDRTGGVTLKFASDGAIWPIQWGDMPDYYNWDVCYAWSVQHFIVWRDHCNEPWDTVDNDITLWLETIRQLHDTSRLLGLRLGLPQRPWRNQILSPSFAHIPGAHAVQMLTGWPPEPTSLEDWDATRCSVILMTWFDNLIDFNWHSKYLPALKELYVDSDWNVPSQWYNPNAPLPRHLAQTQPKVFVQEFGADSEDDEFDITTLPEFFEVLDSQDDPADDDAEGRLIRLITTPTEHLTSVPGPVRGADTTTRGAQAATFLSLAHLALARVAEFEKQWALLQDTFHGPQYSGLSVATKVNTSMAMHPVLEQIRWFTRPLAEESAEITVAYDDATKLFSYTVPGKKTVRILELVGPHKYLTRLAETLGVAHNLPEWM